MIFTKKANDTVNKQDIKIINYPVIPSHSAEELRKYHAGAFVIEPNMLNYEVQVTVFQRGSKYGWEHGEISKGNNEQKHVNCYDGTFEFNEVEVYLDSRYN